MKLELHITNHTYLRSIMFKVGNKRVTCSYYTLTEELHYCHATFDIQNV